MERHELTYPEVGATLGRDLPRGYRHVDVARTVGHGRGAWEHARDGLFAWRLQRAAGIGVDVRVEAGIGAGDETGARLPAPRIAPGTRVLLTPGAALLPRPLRGRISLAGFGCLVVAVVDEPGRAGFAYGTLPGHPERGEELFLLTHDPATDAVTLRVRAFSRHGPHWARLLSPAVSLGQRVITARYLRALG